MDEYPNEAGAAPAENPAKGPKPKQIEIEVNGTAVNVDERELTGAEIKVAAIAQNAPLQANFVLQLVLANGSSKVIGDTDLVRVHPHTTFTAIAPDDNS